MKITLELAVLTAILKSYRVFNIQEIKDFINYKLCIFEWSIENYKKSKKIPAPNSGEEYEVQYVEHEDVIPILKDLILLNVIKEHPTKKLKRGAFIVNLEVVKGDLTKYEANG